MRPLFLLTMAFFLGNKLSAQESVRLVSLDTLCEGKIKFLPKDTRVTCNSLGIIHGRCTGEDAGDYFLTPTDKLGVYKLLNKGGIPMKKSSVFTADNTCIFTLIVDNRDGQYTYDVIRRIWSGPSKKPDPNYSLDAPRE